MKSVKGHRLRDKKEVEKKFLEMGSHQHVDDNLSDKIKLDGSMWGSFVEVY